MVSSLFRPPIPDIALRTRWCISVRWVAITAIIGPHLLLLALYNGYSPVISHVALIAGIAFLSNLILFVLTRFPKPSSYFSHIANALIITDIALISLFLLVSSMFDNQSILLYALPILTAAAITGRKHIYRTTALTIMAYNLAVTYAYLRLGAESQPGFGFVSNILLVSAALVIIGVLVDVLTRALTKQEQYAKELSESMRLAQSIAGIGSWEWILPEKTMVWSDELYSVLGVTKGMVPQDYSSLIKIFTADDQPAIVRELTRGKRGKRYFAFDGRIIDADGSIRYIHTDGQSIKDKSGKVVKLFGTVRDITDAKLLEEARSDFVSLASHQLRTPATGVKQYLKMLQEGYAGSLTPGQDRLVQTAYESNERQLSIIDDLLHVAQIDSGRVTLRLTSVNIITLLREVVQEQELEFRAKDQRITLHSRYKQLFAFVDENRLRMALENIIDNARKYTPVSKAIDINVTKRGEIFSIHIADQGIGIPKADIKRLFQKFSRIESQMTSMVGGSGLGLYWAERIISLHKGTIHVESKVGTGTTFTISLPIGKAT